MFVDHHAPDREGGQSSGSVARPSGMGCYTLHVRLVRRHHETRLLHPDGRGRDLHPRSVSEFLVYLDRSGDAADLLDVAAVAGDTGVRHQAGRAWRAYHAGRLPRVLVHAAEKFRPRREVRHHDDRRLLRRVSDQTARTHIHGLRRLVEGLDVLRHGHPRGPVHVHLVSVLVSAAPEGAARREEAGERRTDGANGDEPRHRERHGARPGRIRQRGRPHGRVRGPGGRLRPCEGQVLKRSKWPAFSRDRLRPSSSRTWRETSAKPSTQVEVVSSCCVQIELQTSSSSCSRNINLLQPNIDSKQFVYFMHLPPDGKINQSIIAIAPKRTGIQDQYVGVVDNVPILGFHLQFNELYERTRTPL
mmetsp:Transcript_23293/g.58936  ORF Transcript_23293/g.58936 Transcript_23293/m.58936 type:complete len:360 (+) Transcript_23293:572-1651(+)